MPDTHRANASVLDQAERRRRIDHAHIARHDLNLLVAFDALMAYRSVTRAAQSVGITQSAMSYNLARLRTLFNDDLFVRTAGEMRPTLRAKALALQVTDVLGTIQTRVLDTPAFDPSQMNRVFTVGVSDYLEALVMPRVMMQLSLLAPKVRLVVHTTDQLDAVRVREELEVDLIVGHLENFGDRYRSHKLWTERVVILCPPEMVDPATGLDLDTFVSARHAVANRSPGLRNTLSDTLTAHGIVRKDVVVTPDLLALPYYLLGGSNVLAAVPESLSNHLAATFGLLACEPPLPLPTFDVGLIWDTARDASAAHAWFRSVVVGAATLARTAGLSSKRLQDG